MKLEYLRSHQVDLLLREPLQAIDARRHSRRRVHCKSLDAHVIDERPLARTRAALALALDSASTLRFGWPKRKRAAIRAASCSRATAAGMQNG